MSRRPFLLVLLVASTIASGWAAEPVTFVLISGERLSGTLIYGRGDNNIVDLEHHLNVGGRDAAIPIKEVAAIDFAGGSPSDAELEGILGFDSPGVMVMRNGSTVPGHLHNIMAKDVVQWVNRAGQRQNWAIRDVVRLYLSPVVARRHYLAAARVEKPKPAVPDPKTDPGERGRRPGTVEPRPGRDARNRFPPGAIRVEGRDKWVDSGFEVRRGDRLEFNVKGTITVISGGRGVGPDGSAGGRNSRYPLANVPAGALIGRVGNGTPFLIGSKADPIVMPAAGALMIGINDDYLDDNAGFFSVTIIRR